VLIFSAGQPPGPECWRANFKPRSTLTFKTESPGPDGEECVGVCAAAPAQKYYLPGDIVMVWAADNWGYCFQHWRGDGQARRIGPGNNRGPWQSLSTATELQKQSEIEIFFEPGHDWTLTAVFENTCGPLNLKMYELDTIQRQFCPGIIACHVHKTHEATPTYNCVGLVDGSFHWVWDDLIGPCGYVTLANLEAHLAACNVTHYIVYGLPADDVSHVAIYGDPCSLSKLNDFIEITHKPEEATSYPNWQILAISAPPI
jgi:hypothetical protein